jgi:hypothetical protein
MRKGLLGFGVLLLAVALAGWIEGWHTVTLAIPGTVLVLAVLSERFVYKPIRRELPGAGWTRTDERFADPRSGQFVVVYFNPRTGERRYVAEERPPMS